MEYLHLTSEQMEEFPQALKYNSVVEDIQLNVGDLVVIRPTEADTEVSAGIIKAIGRKFTILTDFGIFKVPKNMLYPMYLQNEEEKTQQVKELIKWFAFSEIPLQKEIYNLIQSLYSDEVVEFLKAELHCFVCADCGTVCFGRKFTVNNNTICEDCRRANYFTCECCENIEHIKNREENSRYQLCKQCQKREFILPYHKFAPPLKFYKTKRDEPLFLGVELEVDEGGERDENAKKVMSIINKQDELFAYCMRDGSLNNGFEIITQPATLKAHYKKKEDYEKCFDKLLKMGYLSHDTTTCGIHVHFNRDYFADNEELNITKLLYLINKFWNEIVIFSRRNERRLDRYAKKIPTSADRYIRQTNKSNIHEHHYYSLNLSNENTIEFRMFKGSLNLETFFAVLQFVRNIIVVAKNKTTEELQELTFNDLIVGKECKSYWKIRSRYNNTEE